MLELRSGVGKWKWLKKLEKRVELELRSGRDWEVKGLENWDIEVGKWKGLEMGYKGWEVEGVIGFGIWEGS